MFEQQTQEACKQLCGGVLPEFGGKQRAGAEQCADDVEPLAPDGCGGVALTRWCPRASVGQSLRKPGLIDEGQGQLSLLGLDFEFLDFRLGTAKSGVASFFLSEWRVRFRALPSRLRACCTTQVLTLTLNASRSSLPRSTMWASCWLSASDRTRGQGLRDMATSHAHQSSNTSRLIVGELTL
jgi:hypothetical protein